jgi:hypothetical protein
MNFYDYTSTNSDIIDVEDLIARHQELDDRVSASEDPDGWEDTDALAEGPLDDTEYDELHAISDLLDQIGHSGGGLLVRDSYFQEYARTLAEDISDVRDLSGWPFDYIDWERAADSLKHDITDVTYDGIDYWYEAR